jgi:CRP/FNR family cyclic AMP-dependent transcriptional regulator
MSEQKKHNQVERIKFTAGEILMTQGEIGGHAVVIEAGEVQILVAHDHIERLVALAGVGEIVGEMALIDREPRSATVRALTDGEGMVIPWEVFQSDFESSPTLIRNILEILTRNLRRMDGV